MISFNILETDLPMADSREIKNCIDILCQSYYSDICGYLIENLNDMFKKKTYAL